MRVLLIGPLPPPITGNSIINNTIVENFSLYHKNIHMDFINIGVPNFNDKLGKFNLKKILTYLTQYKSIYKIFYSDTVYISVGHTFFGVLKYLPFFLLSKVSRKQLIIHVHTDYLWIMYRDAPAWKQKTLKIVMGLADKGIVLSPLLRRNLQPFIKDEQIYELSNFISKKLLQHDIQKTIVEKKRHPLQILFLSNLIEEKGIIDFLEAMLILKQKKIDFEVHIAGDIPLYMKQKIDIYFERIHDHLHYHGIVTGEKKKSLFLLTNIFIFPTYTEAQPLVILEAMATANIILTTNVGGIPDIFIADKNGFTIENNDPAKIADTVMGLYENYLDLDKMLENNYQEVEQKYTEEKFFDNLYKIIMDKR